MSLNKKQPVSKLPTKQTGFKVTNEINNSNNSLSQNIPMESDYLRSLLLCMHYMSNASRPLGHTLAAGTARPFRVDKKGGAV